MDHNVFRFFHSTLVFHFRVLRTGFSILQAFLQRMRRVQDEETRETILLGDQHNLFWKQRHILNSLGYIDKPVDSHHSVPERHRPKQAANKPQSHLPL